MLSNIQKPHSICLLRLSAIGDVCHAVATVQAIQARWPQAKITWVIGKIEFQLLNGLPGVEFIVFDKKAGLRGYRALYSKMKGRRFDILLHMQVALRASLATLCIKAREKWGFDKKRAKEGQWLFTNRRIAPQSEAHVADGFLNFARAIGVADDIQLKWKMSIQPSEIEWQRQTLSQYGQYVVISPAASKPERNWLPDRYAAFANYVNAQGVSIVLCGGPTQMEKELAAEIESSCDFQPINLVGKTTLKQLLVVLKEAQIVLAPDTGPAHMATTVGTPVIGLYVHSNPKRTGPYTCQQYVVSDYERLLKQQTGKSIQETPWGKRVKGTGLMKNIQVKDVIAQFERLLARFSKAGQEKNTTHIGEDKCN